MSQLLWSQSLLPDMKRSPTVWNHEDFKSNIENIRALPTADKDIVIPDPKAFRSMSRASLFLSNLGFQAKDALASFLSKSPFSVGIYCAVENGPIDVPATQKIIENEKTNAFADSYRKFRNPKMYLKQLGNLAPAQLGISLGIQGPMNVYTHSTHGALHALIQAEWDLKSQVVKAALVCTSHAFDDFVIVKRIRQFDRRTINEGAGAVVLTQSDDFTDWKSTWTRDPNDFFGISDPIINFVKGKSYAK